MATRLSPEIVVVDSEGSVVSRGRFVTALGETRDFLGDRVNDVRGVFSNPHESAKKLQEAGFDVARKGVAVGIVGYLLVKLTGLGR